MSKLVIIQSVYKNDKPEYLSESITSILNQSYADFVYYVGVDGPIGEELRVVLNSFKDKRIRIYENKINKGLACILNDLLVECKNGGFEYIARMDSDDISKLDRFGKQISFLESHKDVDLVGGAINEINDAGNDRGKTVYYPCNIDECRRFFMKRNPVAHPTVMFRRSFFEKAGWQYPTDFERNEDTRLWHEGYKHGCVITNISDVVLNYRVTDEMFKQRRNGKAFAKSQLELRLLIKKELGYGIKADVYAYAMFLLMISPSWMLKIAYKILR